MTKTPESLVYVSITGLRVRHPHHTALFWEHAVRSMIQAQGARGNLRAEARTVDDVHHTLSVWESREAMTWRPCACSARLRRARCWACTQRPSPAGPMCPGCGASRAETCEPVREAPPYPRRSGIVRPCGPQAPA